MDDEQPTNLGHDANQGRIDRRDFLRRTSTLGAAIPFALTAGRFAAVQQQGASGGGSPPPILDLAEWTQGYVGVETITLARGDVFTGKYLSVECWTPRQVRHPFPVIFVHGGNSQGLDWMTTPDGRRGWALQFVEQGYKVFVGRSTGSGPAAVFSGRARTVSCAGAHVRTGREERRGQWRHGAHAVARFRARRRSERRSVHGVARACSCERCDD